MRKATYEYFGIPDLAEKSKKVIMSYIGMQGKGYQGYGPSVFFRKTVNCLDYYMHAKKDPENKSLKYVYPYFHASSLDIFKMIIDDANLNEDKRDKTFKQISVYKEGGDQFAVVNLINADNLPCFVEGTHIDAQVIAYPYGQFRRYDNEESYKKSKIRHNERSYHMGAIIPIGYIDKYIAPLAEKPEDVDAMYITGTVSRVRRCKSKFYGEEEYTMIKVRTDWSSIDVIYTDKQLLCGNEEPVREGDVISGCFWLEGDPAILKYENYSLQKSDLLLLLQNTIELGDPERLRKVLADDVCWNTVSSDEEYKGIDEVIERWKRVERECGRKVFAHQAKIRWRRVREEKGERANWYGPGTKCIVIAYGEPNNHEALLFINRDKNLRINRITIENSRDYLYTITSNSKRKGYD